MGGRDPSLETKLASAVRSNKAGSEGRFKKYINTLDSPADKSGARARMNDAKAARKKAADAQRE